jgi:hypothetical protein
VFTQADRPPSHPSLAFLPLPRFLRVLGLLPL